MSHVYNSFLLFCLEQRNEVKSLFPGKSNQEITSILGKRWRNMTEEQKQKYKEIAQNNRMVKEIRNLTFLILILE